MDSIKLRKWDPININPKSVVMLVGKRGTGKSTLTADILYNLRKHFDAGIAFSATEESNKFWGKHIPDTLIHSDYDSATYGKFLNEVRKINAVRKKPIGSLVLLEDCMGSRDLRRCKHIRSSFFNGRHYGLFFIVTMQYVMDLSPELRSNCDYVIILRNNMIMDREKIWKNFAGMVPTFALFQKIFNRVTSGYDCLVVNNTSRSNDITDCLFWYRAEVHDDFRIGKKIMWEMHYRLKKNQEDEIDNENELDDLRELTRPPNNYKSDVRITRVSS